MRELLQKIEVARRSVQGGQVDVELDALLGQLTDQTGRVMREHEGMAEELLGLYEQLGAVFEIARKLPQVRDENEVVMLLRNTVEESFSRHLVGVVWPKDDQDFDFRLEWWPKCDPRHCAWLNSLLRDTVREASILVRDVPKTECLAGLIQVMTAPVACGSDLVCILVIGRNDAALELRASDMSLLEILCTFSGDLIANIRLHHQLRQISVDLVLSLVCAIDQKDPYTSGHSMRVGHYAKSLGQELGQNAEELQMLEWSALLHDVGKIGIRDDVLKKAGKLTEEEFNHIKEHPVRSFEVVSRVPQLRAAMDGIRHHHERYDGKGYPDGLKGEDIPLQARIIQVADIFDALTSSRSYRKAFDWQKALGIIAEESGTVVDPHLGAVFTKMIRRKFENDPQAWEAMTRYGQSSGGGAADAAGASATPAEPGASDTASGSAGASSSAAGASPTTGADGTPTGS